MVQKAKDYLYNGAADYVFGKKIGKVKLVLPDAVQATYT